MLKCCVTPEGIAPFTDLVKKADEKIVGMNRSAALTYSSVLRPYGLTVSR